jgi:hypothetical protein
MKEKQQEKQTAQQQQQQQQDEEEEYLKREIEELIEAELSISHEYYSLPLSFAFPFLSSTPL